MKRLILACSLMSFVFSGFAYAQKEVNKTKNIEAKTRIEELLTKAERSVGNPGKLNDVIHELRRKIPNRGVGEETRREATKRLVKIFYSIDDSLTNTANKERILEIVGFFDNSPEAHEFFLKVLSSGNVKHRKMALWSVRSGGVHGDDIYEKIKSFEREGILSHVGALLNLARANPARAVEEMKDFLKTTQNAKEFVVVGINLPEGYYEDMNVLDIIVGRYDEFKTKPASPESAGYSPDRAISYPVLWKYIEIKEGAKLKIAMEIMNAKGVCGDDDIPRLDKKIKSRDVVTREAIIDFLDHQIGNGSLNKDIIAPFLDGAKNYETNHQLRQKLEAIIKNNNKRG